jgi:hypothetical protein
MGFVRTLARSALQKERADVSLAMRKWWKSHSLQDGVVRPLIPLGIINLYASQCGT